jgi:glycerol-3-phosphate O-acyltransferase
MPTPQETPPNSDDIKMGPLKEKILKGTHDHYLCVLPRRVGHLPQAFLRLFFRGILTNDAQTDRLKNLRRKGIIVFATKYRSYFDFLFCFSRYRLLDLPFPEIGFGYRFVILQPVTRLIRTALAHLDHFFHHFSVPDPYRRGHIRQQLLDGRAGMLSLIEGKGFYRHVVKSKTDPLRHLIEIQSGIDRPVFIVPHLMFFGRQAERSIPGLIDIFFGSEQRPRRLRKLSTLFKNPDRVFAEMSEPVHLGKFLARPDIRDLGIDEQARELRRELIQQVNRHRQSITGPVRKTREELKQSILTGERLQQFMRQHSENRNLSLTEVHRKAISHLDEIMAKSNMAIIRAGELMVRWIVKIMFDGVIFSRSEMERVRTDAQKAPLILIPCHKSHIDYLIISYILFNHNMPCPLIAAGKNLSFWPLGPFFRGGGAFFIRRSFRGAVLYSKVFSEYIFRLLREGFNIEFFIEGGRSRTGKLILPKLGLLSILLHAFKDGACEDLRFVPIFIGYDRVLEESAYLHELEGGKKEPENIGQVIRARKFLKKRYGKIYLNFHESISLKEVLSRFDVPLNKMPPKQFSAFCRNLGHRMINAINAVTVVTPHALVAGAILTRSRDRFSQAALMDHIETYLTYLYSQEAKLSDTLLMDHTRAIEQVIDAYTQRKFIERSGGKDAEGGDIEYSVVESKRPILEYYKNNCIALFVPAVFTSAAILELDAFSFTSADLYNGYRFLQDFFKNEFAYDIDRPIENYIRKTVKAFIDDAILMPHPTLPDRYNITSAGFRKLKLFSRFLKSYFESYWITLNFFMENPQNSISAKERLKKIQSKGNRMFKRRDIDLKEALSKINYENGADFFISRGIKGSDNTDQIEFYAEKIKRFLSLL